MRTTPRNNSTRPLRRCAASRKLTLTGHKNFTFLKKTGLKKAPFISADFPFFFFFFSPVAPGSFQGNISRSMTREAFPFRQLSWSWKKVSCARRSPGLISPASSRFLNGTKRRTSFSSSFAPWFSLGHLSCNCALRRLNKSSRWDGNRMRYTWKRDMRVITCATAVFEDEAVIWIISEVSCRNFLNGLEKDTREELKLEIFWSQRKKEKVVKV